MADVYHNISIIYYYIEDNDLQLKNINKSLEIYIKLLGERHIKVGKIYQSIGSYYLNNNKIK